jgi:Ser/Thr protein kinase RdoA (MazF antagonist)
VQLFDFDQACYGWSPQDLVNPLYPHYVFPSARIPRATTADLARFFRPLVAGYRTEQPLSAEQLRMADVLLRPKESFVYLILTAHLAQWAATLHLPVDTLRQALAVMEHRLLSGASVVDLDLTTF